MANIETFATLHYPYDLDGERLFPEAIKFEFFQRAGADFNIAIKAGSDAYENSLNNIKTTTGEDKKQENNNQITNHTRNFPGLTPTNKPVKEAIMEANANLPLDTDDHTKEFFKDPRNPSTVEKKTFGTYKSLSAAAGSVRGQLSQPKQTIGNIYLNMPNNISLSEESQWGGQSLGAAGMLTKKGIKNDNEHSIKEAILGSAAGAAGNIVSAIAGGVLGSLVKLPGGGALTGGILGGIGGSTLQRGAEAAFSVAHNPYMEMMFAGIGFRSFKFDFVFRARNKSEIEMVGKIIKAFRQHSRPSWVGGDLGKSFMKYPQEYEIQFLTKINPLTPGEQYIPNQHLPRIKPCVCSSVETNYTPQSIWSAYELGAPVAITLGLTFQETELVMAHDVAKDYTDAPYGNPNSSEPSAVDRSIAKDERKGIGIPGIPS